MNAIVLGSEVLTMTSREIAELTGKERKNVIRDIRTMLDSLQEDGSDLSHQFREEKDARGYTSMFHIDRELTDTLLTGYSIPLRRKVIARWHELEAGKVQPKELSRMEILKLAMDSEQARIEAEKMLALAAPKAEALDRIAQADGDMCITLAAKHIGMPPRKLMAWLEQNRWVYRRAGVGKPTAYQDRIQSGHLTHKVTTLQRQDGTEKMVAQVIVTPKGLAKLAEVAV